MGKEAYKKSPRPVRRITIQIPELCTAIPLPRLCLVLSWFLAMSCRFSLSGPQRPGICLPDSPSSCSTFLQVVTLSEYDHVEEETKEGAKKSPSPGYPLVCVTPCDPHFPTYTVMKERCSEAGINQSSIQFSWEVATPTDGNGARSPFETITDNTPFTSVNHMVCRGMENAELHHQQTHAVQLLLGGTSSFFLCAPQVLDSIYFSRRFHLRCVAKAVDKVGHAGTPLRSNVVTIGTDSAICHTPVVAGTARGFQAQSFIATLKYLDVKHKEHPNR